MLAERIEALRSLRPRHTQVGQEMLSVQGGDLYPMDFLGAAVLNRSMRLIRGFSDLIPSNFMSAAPLVRLQLDNLLRFHAAFLVKDPHRFVMDMLRGKQINQLKGQDGDRLTDAHLVSGLVAKHPEIRTIYDKGCNYVHLSDRHVFHAVQSSGKMQVDITISEEEPEITDALRLDAVDTMIFVTQLILNHIQGWIDTKANPELIQEPLKHAESLLEQAKTDEAKRWLARIVSDHPDPVVVADARRMLTTL